MKYKRKKTIQLLPLNAALACLLLCCGLARAAPEPVFPLYAGAWDYAESRLFFEEGFLWRAGYRARAASEDIRKFYTTYFTENGWAGIQEERLTVMDKFFSVPGGTMTGFTKEDVTAFFASFEVTGENHMYIMMSVQFPWQISGGPGGFGRADQLYPEGTVTLRMHQSASDHFMEYEIAELAHAPAIVLPYVTTELLNRGWREDRERTLFRASAGFDDNIRMFFNDSNESFVVMALPPEIFSWQYVFLRKKGVLKGIDI